jgi:hypothetical protein
MPGRGFKQRLSLIGIGVLLGVMFFTAQEVENVVGRLILRTPC